MVANKIDTNIEVTKKKFGFCQKRNLSLEFCSAADGTNVVKIFNKSIELAFNEKYNNNNCEFEEILQIAESLDKNETLTPVETEI